MNKVPWWAYAAAGLLVAVLVYNHIKQSKAVTVQGVPKMGTSASDTAVQPTSSVVLMEQLQGLQHEVYNWENPAGYMKQTLNQSELNTLANQLAQILPPNMPGSLTATLPTTSNGMVGGAAA